MGARQSTRVACTVEVHFCEKELILLHNGVRFIKSRLHCENDVTPKSSRLFMYMQLNNLEHQIF